MIAGLRTPLRTAPVYRLAVHGLASYACRLSYKCQSWRSGVRVYRVASAVHVFTRFSHSAVPRWLASRAQRDANQPRMESSMFSLGSRTLPFRVVWRPVHNGTPTSRMESSMFSLVSRTLPFRDGWRPVHNGTPTNPEWRSVRRARIND